MTPELVERGGRLIVSAPYNTTWLYWTHAHGGRWDAGSKAWTFPRERREEVEESLADILDAEQDNDDRLLSDGDIDEWGDR